jgi:YbbR domain-containing protein
MKKLFFGNMSLKISALVLSFLLWLFVTSRGQSEMSLEVPLQFKDVPVGLGIDYVSAKVVNVSIRGQERLMKSVKPSDVRVFVDLAKAKKGEGTYYINKDDVQLPYAMSVISITPSSVKVRIEETVTKSVPVRPSVTGSPAAGYAIRSVKAEPAMVTIRGLRSDIRKIQELRTDAVDVTGLKHSVTQEVNVDTGANVVADTNTVKATVTITGG